MATMVEQVHQRAGQDEQVWQCAQQVRAVFLPQEESCDGDEPGQRPFPAVVLLLVFFALVRGVVHGFLPEPRLTITIRLRIGKVKPEP
jgi:hypothetical protein